MEVSLDLRLEEMNEDDEVDEETEEREEDDSYFYSVNDVSQRILRAVIKEDFEKIKELVAEGDSMNIYDLVRNSPLHIAVTKNNTQILRFLVAQDDMTINAINDEGDTPLHVAVALGQFESVQILLDKGADVNLTDNGKRTPLHKCKNADIAYLLINNKANVNARNNHLETPLHAAVKHGNLEIVCMLLYYNADANAIALHKHYMKNPTPFMYAFYYNKNEEIKDILFNYIDEYNVSGDILNVVLECNSNWYVEELIKKGAKVNDDIFEYVFNNEIDLNTFKLIWSHLKADDLEYDIDESLGMKIDLEFLYHSSKENYRQKIEIIMEHSKSSMLELITESTILFYFLDNDVLTHDQFTKFTLVLIEYGLKVDNLLVNIVYAQMGYCELYKILLFMFHEIRYYDTSITSQVICDIRTDLKTIFNQIYRYSYLEKNHLIDALHYWNDNQLVMHLIQSEEVEAGGEEEVTRVKDYYNMFPAFPSLLELARDQTRKYIVSKFNMEKASQYYTYVNCLEIAPVYKQILMYEKKLYYPTL